jgi:hypothetical protein
MFILQNASAQTKSDEIFIFENQKIKYTTLDFKDDIYRVSKFFVIINQKHDVNKCFKNKHLKPYFINIPTDMPKEKQEKLFLEFVSYITGRVKLIDSDFFVISDIDYTGLYKEIFEKEHRYKGYYMNNINDIYLNPTKAEICKMLQ